MEAQREWVKRARTALHLEGKSQEKMELSEAKRLLNDARSLGFNDNDEIFRRLGQQIRTCEKIASVADKLVAVRVRTRLVLHTLTSANEHCSHREGTITSSKHDGRTTLDAATEFERRVDAAPFTMPQVAVVKVAEEMSKSENAICLSAS